MVSGDLKYFAALVVFGGFNYVLGFYCGRLWARMMRGKR